MIATIKKMITEEKARLERIRDDQRYQCSCGCRTGCYALAREATLVEGRISALEDLSRTL